MRHWVLMHLFIRAVLFGRNRWFLARGRGKGVCVCVGGGGGGGSIQALKHMKGSKERNALGQNTT